MTSLVVTEVTQVVTEEVPVIEVLTDCEQGPRGIQGPVGPGGGATTITVGAAPISGHAVVACDASGHLIYADCTNPAHRGAVVGITENAFAPGDEAVVKTAFTMTHAGWSWTPGPVFVGISGLITQALPPGAMFSQVVAHALAPTIILVEINSPITTT